MDADIIVFGHTHRPLYREISGKCVINPGSCGQLRDGDPRTSSASVESESEKSAFGRANFDADAAEREAAAAGLAYRNSGAEEAPAPSTKDTPG